MHLQSKVALICTIAGCTLSAQADIWSNPNPGSFDSPGGYVTWDRGTSGSAFAQWDVFYQSEGDPNHATNGVFGGRAPTFDSLDLLGNPNIGSGSISGTGIGGSSLTQINSGIGAIITSTSNLYSFGGTAAYEFDITDINSFSIVVITTLTSGTEMDYSSFAVDNASILSSQTLYSGTHPTGGTVVETQWLLDLSSSSVDDLLVTFSGAGPHMSMMKLSVDAYSVPVPGTLALLGLGGIFASRRRG